MFDKYNREITYLRVSVTDRCNLRCVYCMPPSGVKLLNHSDILSFEEMADFVAFSVSKGINKVRITGGEPLVRKGVVNFVKMLSEIDGIEDLSMTTNGILLAEHAEPLKTAGLKRINISLDTTDQYKYKSITRNGDIQKVFDGIDAAIKANLQPVKINCVVNKSKQEEDAQKVLAFAKEKGLDARFIPEMTLECGVFAVVDGGTGGDCRICNRLRLTANGILKPCLFSESGYDIRKLGYEKAMEQALSSKPESGTQNTVNQFNNIGG